MTDPGTTERLQSAAMEPPPFKLLYESGPVIVVLKPAGLLTQAPPGIDCMELRVRTWIKSREQKAGNFYLGVPHRIDRPVSGVLVFARNVRAARRISKQFENRQVRKTYWACVAGLVEPAEGTWEDSLLKVQGEPRATVVDAGHPDARPARLHYRTLGQTAEGSWLEIELETGRTHQIRIQAASRGHPVLGDTNCTASRRAFGVQHEDERLRAIALHGRTIEFRHPMNREPVQVVAPLATWRCARACTLKAEACEPDGIFGVGRYSRAARRGHDVTVQFRHQLLTQA